MYVYNVEIRYNIVDLGSSRIHSPYFIFIPTENYYWITWGLGVASLLYTA